jgi:hypothetical protein
LENSDYIVGPYFIRRRGEIPEAPFPRLFQILGLEKQTVVGAIGSIHFGGVFNAHGQNEALVVVGMISKDLHTTVGGP